MIIDALTNSAEAGHESGEGVWDEAKDLRGGHRSGAARSTGLDAALELGHRLGYEMPEEVGVFAIEAAGREVGA